MGSTKKHKHKNQKGDADYEARREHKKKHRHKDPDKKEKKEHREHKNSKKHRRSDSRERKHYHADGEKRIKEDIKTNILVLDEEEHVEGDIVFDQTSSTVVQNVNDIVDEEGGAGLSLSIEETNILRSKLGLKPLDVNGGSSGTGESSNLIKEVHAPPLNMADVKKAEILKEKMNLMKEKRRLASNLQNLKPLVADDEESAAAWVERNRRIDVDRKKAEERARLLEDMDRQFGVDSLINEEFGPPKMAKVSKYSASNLKGLKIEHAQDRFAEGKDVILTIKDKGILDEDNEDILVNYNMLDDERYERNVENKKKKPDYKPYDDAEFDEFGMLKERDVLGKYNEEIDGIKKKSFKISQGGGYDPSEERRMHEIRNKLHLSGESLNTATVMPVIASEYYTHQEMEAFKKPRNVKVRKLRKKVRALTADDLLNAPQSPDQNSHTDYKFESAEDTKREEPALPGIDDIEIKMMMNDRANDEDDDDDDDMMGNDDDVVGVSIEEEEARVELEMALKKTRKLKESEGKTKVEANYLYVKEEAPIANYNGGMIFENSNSKSVMLNATAEFCKSLGEAPTAYRHANLEEDDDDMDMDLNDEEDPEHAGAGWQAVGIDTRPVDITDMDDRPVLDDEPVVDNGIAMALKLASKKGYLDAGFKKVQSAQRLTALEAQHYSIEDKRFDDLDDKYRGRRGGDRYAGGGGEFKEMEDYKPDIKLEYVDEVGRPMSYKEAFRQLSHRFHGKGSGKKKMEKRLKKTDEDTMVRNINTISDNPLNSVQILIERQKNSKVPYIVLSGGKGLAAPPPGTTFAKTI